MFKKRLKGLLAMVLAGSIATTAIPLSASANITCTIEVRGEGGGEQDPNSITFENGQYVVGSGALKEHTCLNENNLWSIFWRDETTSEGFSEGLDTVTGNNLLENLYTYKNDSNTYSCFMINPYHRYVVTTDDPSVTNISTGSSKTVSTFPLTVDTSNGLKQVSSWTAWYGIQCGGAIDSNSVEGGTTTTISDSATSITVPMATFKQLYDNYGATLGKSATLYSGVTIIQLNGAYKTLELPVMNAVFQPEMVDGVPKTISITEGNDGYLDGIADSFYLCYIDEANCTFKISDVAEGRKPELWTKIKSFANTIQNFDASNLKLLRYAGVKVYRDVTIGGFTSKDLFEYSAAGNTTSNTAINYLFNEAKPKSIWKIESIYSSNPHFYKYKENLARALSDYLSANSHENSFVLTEQTGIYVTGIAPTANGGIPIGSYFTSSLYKDNGSAATFSDYAAKLAENQAPQTGKKYDTTGWELWSADTDCGGLIDLTKLNASGINSIGIDQFNQLSNNKKMLIYFPQVDETQSGGGNSGGGNGGGGNGGSGSTGGNTGGNSGNTGSNTGGNSGGSSSRPEPSYDPNKPMIDGVEKSWSDVEKEIGKLPKGGTKTISLFGDRKVPADVIKAIKDSEAVVTFKINSAFSWTVDGSTLTDGDIHDYDFTIEMVTATGTEILRGDVGTSFIIGEITGNALLNINFKKGHEQEFANLYKKVDGKLVFVDNVRIDENGAAIGLEVSEAGEYVVMLGKFSDRAGDMDNDGIMDKKDSFAVINNFLEIEEGANPLVADMNGDGRINAKDAVIIVQKFLGIE